MLVNDWPTAIAHVDADCFYASCERARHPELRDRPVCVLSSQDACVVAKTYDAKAAGITTGMPVWEAKKRLPHAEYLSADFGYYGQVSDQMFAIFARFSPDIEVYSIDEGFLGMHGLRSLWRKGYGEIADRLRAAVRSEIGITVSVGVSVTKTLAKIASEFNKPDGTTIVSGRRIAEFLERVPARAIPGIGASREALLGKFGIATARQFIEADPHLIQRLLGKGGSELRRELRGEPVFSMELAPRLPKSIARTASLGEITSSRDTLAAHLAHHATRVATELVTRRYLAGRLSVFLRLKSFDSDSLDSRFSCPTASYFTLSRAVLEALQRLYRPGELYRGCGVVASEISMAVNITPDLFGVMARDERQGSLLETLDAINLKYGSGTAQMLASLPVKRHGKSRRFRYPLIEVG
jgi:DNA polymerase-4/DNA polymerase V